MSTLGQRIKEKRTELGWTQDELCARARISKGFLSDIENGKQKIGAEKLLDIATVLQTTLDYLMTGSGGEVEQEQIQIPPALARFAERENLSFQQMMALLDTQRRIVAHRNKRGEKELDEKEWQNFYNLIKAYL
jgi:transcriptional regulator with XRE-family HTH domain